MRQTATLTDRRWPVGAERVADGVHFRVWAPRRRRVEVVLEGGAGAGAAHELNAEGHGYFSGLVSAAAAGSLYRFRLDGGEAFPDPASRFQPEGPHGPSQVVDASAYTWHDAGWKGLALPGQVIYELHIGTFTPEGTCRAAAQRLPDLRELGVTVLELMPVADFPGRFGWGYDGVCLFAPSRLYGRPDDLRAFVDQAHQIGLGVILDVVYNHFGPSGNYLGQYSESYVSDRYANEWGDAINFDGEGSGPVRELVVTNAAYWIREFHLDGLRLDATQAIHDASREHVLAAVARAVREAAEGRSTILLAESESQQAQLVRPPGEDGYGLDAVWNDDFHHSALVALTGRREAYYTDYAGSPQELVSACKYGYLYQGQRYKWQQRRRGTPTFGLPHHRFVNYLENHDQVANSGRGQRVHQMTSPGRWRAMTALLLLGPGTPLLFQGQEFAASAPFLYFADHDGELDAQVRAGRREFLRQFRSLALADWDSMLAAPSDPATFERCRIDHREREAHAEAYALHRDLLRLRAQDPVFSGRSRDGLDGAVLGPQAFVLRLFGGSEDRLLLVNMGAELHLEVAPEPLLAPPAGCRWQLLLSTEDLRYGGQGTFPPDSQDNWRLPAESALAMAPREGSEDPPGAWNPSENRPGAGRGGTKP